MPSEAEAALESRDAQVPAAALRAGVADPRADRPNQERSAQAVVHGDGEPARRTGDETANVPFEGEAAPGMHGMRPDGAERGNGTERRRDTERDREPSEAALPHTTITALLALSGPRQLLVAGVTLYCHEPDGTLFSVQVSAAIVPVQLAPMVCRTPEVL